MIDIAIKDLNKYYGSNHVLKGVTFEVYSGERVGLLGKNGSGKTTLFKTITGDEPYESGSVSKASGKKIEMLAQIPAFGESDTVETVLRSAFHEAAAVYERMELFEADANPASLAKYGRLIEEYERLGGYDIEVKLDKVCEGMRLDGAIRRSLFGALSGGERTRVNLARILLRECDILLLDEPTNHLDMPSLEWLEGFLREYKGTVVAISHDRAFLDNVVTRIIEIDDGKADFYSGNYSFYVEERERRYQTQAEQYKQQQRKIEQLEVAIRRQRVWADINKSNAGLAKRALAMEKRIEQMDKVERPRRERTLNAEFEGGGYASKEVAALDCVSKRYGGRAILDGICASVRRGDRIALIGANGCGKSTLIRLLAGEETPDGGAAKLSPSAKLAYMPQMIEFEDESATVLDTLSRGLGLPEGRARSVLAGFHFYAADAAKKVSSLSGGERSRLKLCMLMQNGVNLLLLDEPTNHLDIASREWIESALDGFEGTMLIVSHDRYFLDRFATKVWSMENGLITQHNCGFGEYIQSLRAESQAKSAVPAANARRAAKPKPAPQKPAPSAEKLVGEAEAELAGINADIEADLSRADYSRMRELYDRKAQIEERIERLLGEWLEQG